MFQYMCKECKRLFESPVKLGEDTEKICEHCMPMVIPTVDEIKPRSIFIELTYPVDRDRPGFNKIWIDPDKIEFIETHERYSSLIKLTSGITINVKETPEKIMKKIAEQK